jgi:hypothetical protein
MSTVTQDIGRLGQQTVASKKRGSFRQDGFTADNTSAAGLFILFAKSARFIWHVFFL